MDKILEAVMLSTYPINVKQGLARRVIEAAKQPMDSAQCWAMLELSTKLFLVGDTKFKREIGQEVLEVYGRYHLEAFVEFFNAHFLLTLLQEGYGTPGHPSPYVLDYVQLGLQFIPEGPPAEGVFALLRLEVLRKVCERPGPRQCAKVARLLSQYPRCIPDGRHRLLFCQQLVRCIGQFQCLAEGEEGIVEFLSHVNQVSGLLPKIWSAQASSILLSLKELFAIISSTEEQEPPSNALASVVQYVPLELMDGVIRNLTNDDSISDAQMMTAISRMIDWVSWPLGKNIDKWIITLLKGLAAVKKFSILIEVSLSKIEKVFSKLLYPIVREAALSVLKYMLLSFQHSHEAFHLLLPHIPKMVASLAEEDSNSRANCLEELAELIHCMVFRFSGFPDLYEPVMEAIKDLHVPNEDRIKQLLGQNAWTSQKNELVCFYPRLAAKSDTGKIGLINLGNTCYMNSVIQALFMASDFRHCVLHLPEDNSQPLMTKLQWLFAFLEHSQRPAVSPESFLSASWTPWFSPGAQQDCSEYLKYLLDRLHEEEKTGKRICQKLKQSNTPSPPEEQPSPNSSPNPSPTAVEKMFGGKIVTRIRCLRCLNVSTREEAFTDLSLAFPPPDRRRRRVGSVMLPVEDVRVQGPPSPAKTPAPGTEGARRQRKHCIAGDALPPVVSIEILGFQEPGGHRGNFRQEDEKENKEKEKNNDKEKEEKEEGKEKAQKKEKEEEIEKKQEEEKEKMEEREKKEESEDKKHQKEKEKKKEEEEKEVEKKKEKEEKEVEKQKEKEKDEKKQKEEVEKKEEEKKVEKNEDEELEKKKKKEKELKKKKEEEKVKKKKDMEPKKEKDKVEKKEEDKKELEKKKEEEEIKKRKEMEPKKEKVKVEKKEEHEKELEKKKEEEEVKKKKEIEPTKEKEKVEKREEDEKELEKKKEEEEVKKKKEVEKKKEKEKIEKKEVGKKKEVEQKKEEKKVEEKKEVETKEEGGKEMEKKMKKKKEEKEVKKKREEEKEGEKKEVEGKEMEKKMKKKKEVEPKKEVKVEKKKTEKEDVEEKKEEEQKKEEDMLEKKETEKKKEVDKKEEEKVEKKEMEKKEKEIEKKEGEKEEKKEEGKEMEKKVVNKMEEEIEKEEVEQKREGEKMEKKEMEKKKEEKEMEKNEKEGKEKIEKKKEKKVEKEEKEKEEKKKEGEVCLGLRAGGNQGVAFGEQMCGPEGSRSVPDLLNYFLSPETLTAENRYHCEHCASLQDAEKVVELSEGPRYLILTLLRFSFDLRTMRRKKILDNVSIPLFLRLPMAGGCPQQEQGQACAAYDLCSVVVHSGISSESGHYYCYAREGATAIVNPSGPAGLSAAEKPPGLESQWYLFNDTRVSFSSFESVSNVTSFFPKDTAYVLFYRQRVREGWKAEPKSPRPHPEPALHKDLIEAISKDNILYLQEKEARSRSAYISTLPKSPPWGRDFDEDKDEDDEGSPGGCDPAAGGSGSSFHRLVF
ncbi:ubiquitin carboxyl-terminal hydrolase 35 isoform 2-T5 [Sarcophilus harrisii]|uniref:Ubiquitin specific peptidase 35 n=1 Tax=Sarcophilus harrisii TaxID=9305 RepID=A0A7N4P7X0_SARHA